MKWKFIARKREQTSYYERSADRRRCGFKAAGERKLWENTPRWVGKLRGSGCWIRIIHILFIYSKLY